MTEAGTLAIREDVLKFAGANANSTYTAEAYTNVYIKMAEGVLSVQTRYDWVSNYVSVSNIGKEALRTAVASYAAVQAIEADMSGFSSRQEALMMINVLWANYREMVNLITKDNNYKDFILTGEGDID